MKRIIVCLFAVLAVCLTGCAEKRSGVKPNIVGISFKANITYYNECYECDGKIDKEGNAIINFLVPEETAGLSFTCTKDKITAAYDGLEYSYKLSQLPQGDVCTNLYKVITDVTDENTVVIDDKDQFYIKGRINRTEYTMYIAPSGLPLSLQIPDDSFRIIFKNVTIG